MTITGGLFLLAFFAGIALALFRNPMFGLYVYIAEFYLHPPSRWWGASLPDVRWSFLAAGITVLAIWLHAPANEGRERRSWLSTPSAKIMVAFTLWFWCQSLWALDGAIHYAGAVLITKYVVIFYMVYRLVDTPAKLTGFLLAHVAGCLYLGLVAYGVGAPGGRLDGVGGPGIDDSNTLGMQMATAVVVAGMLAVHLKGWRFLLCIVAIVFALNTIVLSGSRGAFLSLLAGGAMLAYLKPPAYRRTFYVFALLGLVAIGYVATGQFWNRMATTQLAVAGRAEEMDTSAYSRIAIIKAQFQMFKEYPFGTGHRGTEILSPRFIAKEYLTYEGGRSSHNAFMTVLVEQGIPGVFLFFAMVGWTGASLRRLARTSTKTKAPHNLTRAVHVAAIGGALAAVFAAGLFADFSKCEVQIWMLAALAGLASREFAPRESTRFKSRSAYGFNQDLPDGNRKIDSAHA